MALVTVQLRRGNPSDNPVLADGEPGWDDVNKILKIGDGITPWTGLPPFGLDVPSGQIRVPVLQTPFWSLRWNAAAPTSADYFGGETASTGTANDEVQYQFACQAGTYTFDLFHKLNTNRGIYTVSIDGVFINHIDGYGTSGTQVRSSLTGIALTDGLHTVDLRMSTKNASSTSYFGCITGMALTRTGP